MKQLAFFLLGCIFTWASMVNDYRVGYRDGQVDCIEGEVNYDSTHVGSKIVWKIRK